MTFGRVAGALLSLALLGAPAPAGAEPLVYVSNERSNNVTVIDASSDKVVATIPSPIGLAASDSPDGGRSTWRSGTTIRSRWSTRRRE